MSLMTTLVLVAAGLVGATGLILGVFLGVASEKFKVEVDETEAKIRGALPGNNCGACGFPGCDGCAKAMALGEAPVTQCPVGGSPVAEKIAQILGAGEVSMDQEKRLPMCIARVLAPRLSRLPAIRELQTAMTWL